jgi:hypothetical protein
MNNPSVMGLCLSLIEVSTPQDSLDKLLKGCMMNSKSRIAQFELFKDNLDTVFLYVHKEIETVSGKDFEVYTLYFDCPEDERIDKETIYGKVNMNRKLNEILLEHQREGHTIGVNVDYF